MADVLIGKPENREEEICECHFCKTKIGWESGHEIKGNVWNCEECSVDFCSACFMEKTDEKNPPGTAEIYEEVLCPNCFTEENVIKE